jgi:hypothetical protein
MSVLIKLSKSLLSRTETRSVRLFETVRRELNLT